MKENTNRKPLRRLAKKILIGATFIGLAGVMAMGTAHAERHHGHHWHGEWHGGYVAPAPDYYYAPSPGYYTAPEPYEYYGPQPAPAPSGFGLFFGF